MRAPTILVTLGTRPEAIKLARVISGLQESDWASVRVVATAQHRRLLDECLELFEIHPDVDLDLMEDDQQLAVLTGRLISTLDRVLQGERPDMVLTQGDTTTAMATGLCCYYRRIPVGHIEAGLRTGTLHSPFPEELNRVFLGRMADLLFAPTSGARDNLLREGRSPEQIHVTGNTVIDSLQWVAQGADERPFLPENGRRLVLVTAHRRESFGEAMVEICSGVLELAKRRDVEILYPVHFNPNVGATVYRMLDQMPRVRLIEPLDYQAFVGAMKAAYLVLTDSGGVQEEAPALGKPVLVLRRETERPEGMEAGTARLVAPDRRSIVREASSLLDDPSAYQRMAQEREVFGDGHASERIIEVLRSYLVED
ncbi:MAG: non-hydrolyzing UDP-N-acetylglucosamine 2-epimerase [Planctomycetota bacterium]